jgi:uncharacterized membrane protein (UPF0127 family)
MLKTFKGSKVSLVIFITVLLLANIAVLYDMYTQNMAESDDSDTTSLSHLATYPKAIYRVKGISLYTYIADSPARKDKGLGGISHLPENSAMFFPHDTSALYGFWMKEMLMSIDMIFLDENLKIITIHKSVSPETFPKVFTSEEPAMYVLEVKAGFLEKNGIEVGEKIIFEKNL